MMAMTSFILADNTLLLEMEDTEGKPGVMNIRDPKNTSGYIQMKWEDMVAEGPDLQTPKFWWTTNKMLYHYIQFSIYILLTFSMGLVITIPMAIINGLLVFLHVWIIGPILRFLKLALGMVKRILEMVVHAVVVPCVIPTMLVLSQVTIRHVKHQDDPRPPHDHYKYFDV